MRQDFERLWRTARTCENNGDIEAARSIYASILALEPHRLYVRMRLSAIEQTLGNYRASRQHALAMADTVRLGRWSDLVPVARRLLSFEEHDIVRGLIADANWRTAEILDNASTLSLYLCLTDDVAEGLRLIDLAIASGRLNHATSYARANALRYSGQTDQATDEYERSIALRPHFAEGHWSLAYHQKASPPGSRVDRIKQAQAAVPADSMQQIYLHYALFKELDDAGETGLAWKSLAAGMEAKRRSVTYDSAIEERSVEAVQQLTTRDFVFDDGAEEAAGASPIFIVGLPRTGTTLLERIMGNHSQVTAAGELNDFNCALSVELDAFLGTIVDPTAISALKHADYRRVGRLYLQRTGRRSKGKPFFTDKNPANFFQAGFICKALPQAKIICLNRHPMDACLSNLKALFPSDETYGYSYRLDELADHYLRFVRLRDHWREVAPERFIAVDYEDLIADPSATTREIMRFCGLPFEPDCVDITRNKTTVATASSSQVRQPINDRSIGAWRRYADQLEPLRARIERPPSRA